MTKHLLAPLVVLAALARSAAADPDAAQPHIERATQLYNEGKTAEALGELTIAYQLAPSPQLLYAIAQAHVVLDQCEHAISFYEQFLASGPKEGPAKLAQQAIEHCKKKLAEAAAPPAAEPPAPPPAPLPSPPAPESPEPPTWYARPIPMALIGGGVIAGAIGGVFYARARSDIDAAATAVDYAAHHELIERGKGRRTLALFAGLGGVGLIGAGVAYIAISSRSADPGVAVAPARGGATISWSGRF